MREMGNENLMLAFIETFSPPEEVDMHAKKTLQSKLFSYAGRERIFLAKVRYIVDGKKYDSFMDLLFETSNFENFQIYFVKPKINENWEYDVPTVEMNIKKGGYGKLTLACAFDPYSFKRWNMENLEPVEEEAMFRFYFLDFFYPESIRSQSLRGDMDRKYPFTFDLFLFEDFLKFTKKFGVLPLVLRVCAYTKHFRFTYDIDITNDALIANFRAGKFPVSARIFRHPKQYYYLDKTLATADIGEHPKKVLETVFETRGVSVFDIANAYGLSEKMAEGSLEVCVKYGYLEKTGKPPSVTYIPRFESFGGVMDYAPPRPAPKMETEKKERQVEPVSEEETICPVCHERKSPEEIVCERCARASEIIAEQKDENIAEIGAGIFSSEAEPETEEQDSSDAGTAVGMEGERDATTTVEEPKVGVENMVKANGERSVEPEMQGPAVSEVATKPCICSSCGFEVSGSICTSCGYRLGEKHL
ncbi:MAG: hypothetical protein N3F63_04380 [Thermoplasmata archaeon]|nr:hypothetical protein [Thermoplasmata archaeon]